MMKVNERILTDQEQQVLSDFGFNRIERPIGWLSDESRHKSLDGLLIRHTSATGWSVWLSIAGGIKLGPDGWPDHFHELTKENVEKGFSLIKKQAKEYLDEMIPKQTLVLSDAIDFFGFFVA
jgi:hypothetical protein